MRGLVPANRAPVSAPTPTTPTIASHSGSTALTNPPPCRTAEPSMVPNNRPPGSRSQNMASPAAVDTANRTASSRSEPLSAPARVIDAEGPASPNSARPAGRPAVSNKPRIVCTTAMARTSALYSVESSITCAIEPGLAPNNAETRSQPCMRCR